MVSICSTLTRSESHLALTSRLNFVSMLSYISLYLYFVHHIK